MTRPGDISILGGRSRRVGPPAIKQEPVPLRHARIEFDMSIPLVVLLVEAGLPIEDLIVQPVVHQ